MRLYIKISHVPNGPMMGLPTLQHLHRRLQEHQRCQTQPSFRPQRIDQIQNVLASEIQRDHTSGMIGFWFEFTAEYATGSQCQATLRASISEQMRTGVIAEGTISGILLTGIFCIDNDAWSTSRVEDGQILGIRFQTDAAEISITAIADP